MLSFCTIALYRKILKDSGTFCYAQLFMTLCINGERLYYRIIPAPDVEPNCKDVWSDDSLTNSVSHTMNRIFEMQCENRHPSPDAELRHPKRAPSGTSNPTTTPSKQD